MAIILNNGKTRAVISPSELNITSGLCRETTISIANDGSVSTSGILNLGFQGDNNVTVINIDTSKLNWGNLNGVNLRDAYKPILIFRNLSNNETTSIEFEGNYFQVPQTITKNAVSYEIIYTLQELTADPYQGNVGEDSDEGRKEVFISQVFKGTVHPSVYGLDKGWDEPDGDLTSELIKSKDYEALYKPEVSIQWVGKNGLSAATTKIGNQFDSLITPLCFNGLPEVDSNTKWTVYFWGGDYSNKYVFNNINQLDTIWVPSEVTQVAQTWNMAIEAEFSSGQKLYSNTITLQVVGNFLTSTDLNEDDVQNIAQPLYDENGDLMTLSDEDGNPITTYIETLEASGQSYTLGFSGAEVNELLGWVDAKQVSINTHLLDTVIHVTQIDKTKWNGYDGRLQKVEDFVDNYNEEGLAADVAKNKEDIAKNTQKISENTNEIIKLRSDLGDLEKKEANDINLIDIRVDSVERRIETVLASDTQQSNDINQLRTTVDLHTDALASMSGLGGQLTNEITKRAEEDILIRQSITTLDNKLTAADENINKSIEDLVAEDTKISSDLEAYKTSNDAINTNQNTNITNLSNDLAILERDHADFKEKPILKTDDIQAMKLLEDENEYLALVDSGEIIATMLYLIKEEEE